MYTTIDGSLSNVDLNYSNLKHNGEKLTGSVGQYFPIVYLEKYHVVNQTKMLGSIFSDSDWWPLSWYQTGIVKLSTIVSPHVVAKEWLLLIIIKNQCVVEFIFYPKFDGS